LGTAQKGSQRTNDSTGVLAMLRAFIEAGQYQVGQNLPPERVLAETLGVGRPSVREGIKALSILDILESRRGSGTFIKSLDALHLDWPDQTELPHASISLLDLLEVRKMIEPTAARLAATRASEVDLTRIQDECERIESATSWEGIGQHDLMLHTAIIEGACNPVLTSMNQALARISRESREVTAHNAPDCRLMIEHHRLIVDAIFRGEGDIAERAMLEHLHHVGLDLIANRKR
jgi:GntR family transcriptional repressor for pyruvate dehydrogenase complex